jgi:hypothetical protein
VCRSRLPGSPASRCSLCRDVMLSFASDGLAAEPARGPLRPRGDRPMPGRRAQGTTAPPGPVSRAPAVTSTIDPHPPCRLRAGEAVHSAQWGGMQIALFGAPCERSATECSRRPHCHAPAPACAPSRAARITVAIRVWWRHSLAPGGGQPRGMPETVVAVFGQVGSLKQRVILPGGQGGWPQKH